MDSNFTVPEPDMEMPRMKYSTAATHIFFAGMSEFEPTTFSLLPSISQPEPDPKISEPIAVVPLTALCPPTLHSDAPQFSSIHEEYIAEQEGLRRMAEKVQEDEQKKKAARGTKGTKPKIVDLEGNRGTRYLCKIEEGPMKLLLDEGFLKQDLMTFTEVQATSAPPKGYSVLC